MKGIHNWILKFSKNIKMAYKNIVVFCAICVLVLLAFYNATMTSYLVKWEVTYYVEDSVLVNILFVVIVVVVSLAIRNSSLYGRIQSIVSDYKKFKKIKCVAVFVVFGISVFVVVSTQFIPGVDEGEIQQMIYDFLQKDYYMFAPTGYLNRYHHNIGLFWYEYCVALIFGAKNYLIYELINSFAISMIYKELSEIGGELGLGRLGQLMVILFGIIFLPVELYSVFIYGNIIGLAFSVTAVKYELQFFKSMEIKKCLFCVVFISMALCVKSTMLIYFLAITCCALIMYITTMKRQIVIFFAFLIIGFEVQAITPIVIAERVTGYELDNSVSFCVWIAMGLQESDLAPGWWNGYEMASYWENGCDVQQQKEAAIENIKYSVKKFANDPNYALEFFTKKIASTWANPSFQCFGTVRSGTNIEIPKWVEVILSYQGQYIFMQLWNIMEFGILLGALFELLFGDKRQEYINSLILPMVMIGGFIYLIFSEAKARYALLFFVILVPYAVMGYATVLKKIYTFFYAKNMNIRAFIWNKEEKSYYKVILCLIVLTCCIIVYGINEKTILIENTDEYYEIQKWNKIEELNQYLTTLDANQYSVYFAIKDIQGYCLTKEHVNNLKSLGFDQAERLLEHEYHNFVGILCNGKVVYQYIGDNGQHVYEGIVNGENIRIESSTLEFGNNASIKIEGKEYAVNSRGINIVVVNNEINKVVDSVAFDTHVKEISCSRK